MQSEKIYGRPVSFNIGMPQAMMLGALVSKASNSMLAGKPSELYFIWQEIRENFVTYQIDSGKPDGVENKKLDKQEEIIDNLFFTHQRLLGKANNALTEKEKKDIMIYSKKVYFEYIKSIKNYRRTIWRKIHELGYIPKRADRSTII